MKKFKVGDRVIGIYDFEDTPITGVPGTVVSVKGWPPIGVHFDKNVNGHSCNLYSEGCELGFGYYVNEDAIRLLRSHKVVITAESDTTLARLYDGKKVIRTAEARCSPDDTYDFEVGAKIAFERLMEDRAENL